MQINLTKKKYLCRLDDDKKTVISIKTENFDTMFELMGGCDACICNTCTNDSCREPRCNECDIYSLKLEKCIYTCSTCAFSRFEVSSVCEKCHNFSEWREPHWVESIDTKRCIFFDDANKNRVFRELSEIRYDIYPTFDSKGDPVIVIPDEDSKLVIPLNTTIVIDGKRIGILYGKEQIKWVHSMH